MASRRIRRYVFPVLKVNTLTKRAGSDKGRREKESMKKKSRKEKLITAEFQQEVVQQFPRHLALFFLSAYGTGLAVFLARFFSLTSWGHYGSGFLILSLSGVVAASVALYLFTPFFQRNHSFCLFWLPFVLLLVSGIAFHFVFPLPFDLQGSLGAAQQGQVALISFVLFFVFFLIGLYLGISWSGREKNISKICAMTFLAGGTGVLFVLVAGIWLNIFYIPVVLILLVSLSALCQLFVMPYGSFLALLSFLVFLTGFVEWRVVEIGRKVEAISSQHLIRPGTDAEEKFSSSVDALPYILRPTGQYALIGTQKGLKIHSLRKEQRVFWAVESMKFQFEEARKNIAGMDGIHLICNTPLSLVEKNKFDLVDMASDFLEQEDANCYTVTVESFSQYMVSLTKEGILSIPVRIDDFPEYGAKMVATVYQALEKGGLSSPDQHIIAYQSPKEMRILASPQIFTEKDIEIAGAFCRDNGLDLVWDAGHSGEEKIGEQINNMVQRILQGKNKTSNETEFNLSPATWDRPFFYGIIPLTALPHFWGQLKALPLTEQGLMIQVVIFSLILVFGGVVLFLFLKKDKADAESPMLFYFPYFAILGMAFTLVTAVLSQRGAFFLGNSQDAIATTLLGMFIFSGIGAYRAFRFDPFHDQGIKWSVLRMVICLVAYMFILIPILSLLLSLSPIVKKVTFLLVTAPVAYAAGISLSLGMEVMTLQQNHYRVFPAIMGIYILSGIFILPVANIFAMTWGIPLLFFFSVLLYFMAFWFYPRYRRD